MRSLAAEAHPQRNTSEPSIQVLSAATFTAFAITK
jgi:hypothetical protein